MPQEDGGLSSELYDNAGHNWGSMILLDRQLLGQSILAQTPWGWWHSRCAASLPTLAANRRHWQLSSWGW